jgi:hypothetical protein
MAGSEVGILWCYEPADESDWRVFQAPPSVAHGGIARSTQTSVSRPWTRLPVVVEQAAGREESNGREPHGDRLRTVLWT